MIQQPDQAVTSDDLPTLSLMQDELRRQGISGIQQMTLLKNQSYPPYLTSVRFKLGPQRQPGNGAPGPNTHRQKDSSKRGPGKLILPPSFCPSCGWSGLPICVHSR